MNRISLSALIGFTLASAQMMNGQSVGAISFESASYLVNEQSAYRTVKVLRSGGSSGTISATYNTSDGTALASGPDYAATSGTLIFADGETEKVITVQIANETTPLVENAETFNLTLAGPQVGGISNTVFTLNDPPVIGTFTAPSTAIGTATAPVSFTIADPETAAADLSVTAFTSNLVLLPASGIVLGGMGENRTITLTPAAALAGLAQVTILVTDPAGAVAVRHFNLSVGPTAAAPVAIPAALPADVVLTADDSYTLGYTVSNSAWVTTVSRSNTTLFNAPGTGTTSDLRTQQNSAGTARTLRIRPKDNSTAVGLYGLSTVTLGFTGTGAPASQTFNVRVNPRAVADNTLLGIPGKTNTFDILANDPAPVLGHTFAITSVSTPANGTLTITPDGQLLRYTPTHFSTGFDTFTYTVTVSSSDAFNGYQFIGIGYVKIGGYAVVDSVTSSQHTDLDFDYMNGTWQQIIRTDATVGGSVQSGTFSPSIFDADEGILFFDPSTKIPRPDFAPLDALGIPVGADVWYGPTSGDGNKIYLGIANESTEGEEAYIPVGDSRATGNARWVATQLVGFSGPGNFAAFVGSNVAFDTLDGLNSATDSTSGGNVTDTFWGFAGSHAHPAWYFTAPGNYTLTFQTTVKSGGVFVTSPPTTFYVAVDTISGNAFLGENPPLARPDLLAAVENGGAVTLDVIANDSSEADGFESLTLTSVGNSTHGTTALQGDGKSVTYTPNAEFNGTDSFTYTVTDEHGGIATGTVSVTVTGDNDLPTFAGMSANTIKDSTVTIPLAEILAKSSDPEGNPITISAVSPTTSAGGTVTLEATSLTYTPASGFIGADTLTFTLSDGIGMINHALSITVSEDPLFTSSRIGVTATLLSGDAIRLSFQGIPGRTYAVQRSTTLAPGSWTQIGTVAAVANTTATFDDPTPPEPAAFYRVTYPAQ